MLTNLDELNHKNKIYIYIVDTKNIVLTNWNELSYHHKQKRPDKKSDPCSP